MDDLDTKILTIVEYIEPILKDYVNEDIERNNGEVTFINNIVTICYGWASYEEFCDYQVDVCINDDGGFIVTTVEDGHTVFGDHENKNERVYSKDNIGNVLSDISRGIE